MILDSFPKYKRYMRASAIVLTSLLILLGINTFGQDKNFRLGANGGFVILTGADHVSGDKGGFSGHLDGEYLIQDQIGVGLEVGFVTLKNAISLTGLYFNNEVILPILLKGRYYLSKTKVQPYTSLGLGVGLFFPNGSDLSNIQRVQTNFSLKPEIGVRIHWFNVAVAYEFNGKYDVAYRDNPINYNYIEITVGLNLFLGPKH